MEQAHALAPAITLLVAGILAIAFARPLRVSPIVGYLAGGMAVGPHGLALISDGETTHLLAELGVVFLLFDIGLHFALRHIWAARRDILGLGPLQVTLCCAGFAFLAVLGGVDLTVAVVVGATLALSSTAAVAQTLKERGQQDCPVGVSSMAVLIFQDVCAIFLLILAHSLAGASGGAGAAIGAAAIKALIAFAVAVALGRFLIGPAFAYLARTRNEEIYTASALLIVLLAASATGLLGLSLTLGAFLGGMIIAETPYRHVVQAEVKPFRGLLLGFFFITVGMTLDPVLLVRDWAWILAAVSLLLAIKTALGLAASLLLRMPAASAVQFAFLLAQGSEFAFVILAFPAVRTALGPDISAVLITAVAASLALTPLIASVGQRFAKTLAGRNFAAGEAADAAPAAAPIVVFGMDTIGRRVADGLTALGYDYTAFEMDHDRFIAANADGYPVAFGDAADLRLMENIDLARRAAIVVTIPRFDVSHGLTPIMRERYPGTTRFVAVENDGDKARFDALGMHAVVTRSMPAGLDMAAEVLRHQGAPEQNIAAWMKQVQDSALEIEAAPVPPG